MAAARLAIPAERRLTHSQALLMRWRHYLWSSALMVFGPYSSNQYRVSGQDATLGEMRQQWHAE